MPSNAESTTTTSNQKAAEVEAQWEMGKNNLFLHRHVELILPVYVILALITMMTIISLLMVRCEPFSIARALY